MAISKQLLALAILLQVGCASRGILYSHVTEPATIKFDRAPTGTKKCVVPGYKLREPVTGYGISAEWDSNYLKMVARQAGITNMYYADLDTLSILFRVYQRRTLIIYGD